MAFRHAEPVMGTVFSIEVRDDDLGVEILPPVLRRLAEIDRCFSTYRSDSVISRLNRGELALPDAPEEVRQLLVECESWRQRTDGWFDVRCAGEIDPSGYVKGWAIRQAGDLLSAAGSKQHCVNGGGDIQARGTPESPPWTFGVIDPADRDQVLATVTGTSVALATSGTAERGAHLLDPFTHRPVLSSLASLTVVGGDIIECDVLATAGFAMGDGALDWFSRRSSVRAFGARAFAVRTFGVRLDGSTFVTPATAEGFAQ